MGVSTTAVDVLEPEGAAIAATGTRPALASAGGPALPAPPRRAFRLGVSQRRTLLLVVELAASALALALATLPRGWWHLPGNQPVLVWFVSLLVIDVLVARVSDADDLGKASNAFHGSYVSVRAWVATCALYLALPYVSAPLLQSRAAVAVFVLAGLALRVAWRTGYALLARQPRFVTRVAIIGSGPAATTIADAIEAHLGPEYQVLGCIDEEIFRPGEQTGGQNGPVFLGGPERLDELLRSGSVSKLILATSGVMPAPLYAGVMRAYEAGVPVVPMPVFYEAVTGRVPVEHVGDYWYVALPKMEQDWAYVAAKRCIDVAGGLVGLAVTVVLFPAMALAVRLSGPGPILYSQTRLGLRGRPFRVWKFRSMVDGAEADGVARWAQAGDPRVTGAGRFLRASHLDELPQFWNVLRGEMSLVGPRPERPEFVERLQHRVPFYRVRLLARPGLTGWAQVKQPHAASVEDSLKKLQYDLYYVGHQSIYLDLLILAKTVALMLGLGGGSRMSVPRLARALVRSRVALSVALIAGVAAAGAAGATRPAAFGADTSVVAGEHRLERVRLPAPPGTPPSETVVVRGRLRNHGARTSNLIRVVVTFTGAGGEALQSATGYAVRWGVSPGEEAPFVVAAFADSRIKSYDIRLEEAHPAGGAGSLVGSLVDRLW